MIEVVLDTHVLADLLKQFITEKPDTLLTESKHLSKGMLKLMNQCINSDGVDGIIIASSFAFIEILNQFEKISAGIYRTAKLLAILQQPPNWLVIEPFNNLTLEKLILIPKFSQMGEKVELADAIHLATAMQRGPKTYLASLDGKLINLRLDALDVQLVS